MASSLITFILAVLVLVFEGFFVVLKKFSQNKLSAAACSWSIEPGLIWRNTIFNTVLPNLFNFTGPIPEIMDNSDRVFGLVLVIELITLLLRIRYGGCCVSSDRRFLLFYYNYCY